MDKNYVCRRDRNAPSTYPPLTHLYPLTNNLRSDPPTVQIYPQDPQVLVFDLASLADMLAPSFRLAYENWCWATHAAAWSSVYEIVKLANRPNIGLCLDTFQTFGSEYADPRTHSGLIEDQPT